MTTHADTRLQTLLEVTGIPTASGREQRVTAYIRRWVKARPGLTLSEDAAGNLVVSFAPPLPKGAPRHPPLFITGHLDHPAFVVERIVAPGVLEMSFRGGVMEAFFESAPVLIHTDDGAILRATLTGKADASTPAGVHYLAEVEGEAGETVKVGDVGTWDTPGPEIDSEGVLHTPACDDLAAVAAAMCAMDALWQRRRAGEAVGDVRLLFTLAEEIGFIGAIAACRLGTIPKGSRVIALENSRAFAESPVGGGPIVRVGDRVSVFTPWLTGVCAQRAEETFGGPATPRASQTAAEAKKRPWQRKLMAGGACEASVFCHAGYDATCICLPLGNYHNMPHLDALQAGTYDRALLGSPRAAREFIHTQDYLGMVDLLVAIALRPPEPGDSGVGKMVDRLYAERSYVLGAAKPATAKAPAKRASPAKSAKKSSPRKPARAKAPRTGKKTATAAARKPQGRSR